MSMTDEKVKRINELYHKAKAEGLTETEKKEQALLREEYIASFRKNLRSQLNQIDIQNADGSVESDSEMNMSVYADWNHASNLTCVHE